MEKETKKNKSVCVEQPRVVKSDYALTNQPEEDAHNGKFAISPPKLVIDGIVSTETEKGSHITERFIWDAEKIVPVQMISQGVLPCGQRKDLQGWRERDEDETLRNKKENQVKDKEECNKKDDSKNSQRKKYIPPTMGDPNDPIVNSVFLTFSPDIARKIKESQERQKQKDAEARMKAQSENKEGGAK